MIETLSLYLTGREMQVRRRRWLPWPGLFECIHQESWSSEAPATLDLRPLRAEFPQCRLLHVVLGGALSKFLVIQLPAELKNTAERLAAAEAQMQQRMGLSPEEWAVCIDFQAAPAASIAWAVRRDLLAQLRSAARTHGLMLRSIRPFISGVWDEFSSKAQGVANGRRALLILEADACTTMWAQAGELQSIGTAPAGDDMLARELRRLRILAGHGRDSEIILAAGQHALPPAVSDTPLLHAPVKNPRYRRDFRDLVLMEPV
jgi:hypothetical protein